MKTRKTTHTSETRTGHIKIKLRSLHSHGSSASNEILPDPLHPQLSQAALKMRRYRLHLKNDDNRLQTARESERIRSALRRQCMSEQQKMRNKELSRERMRRYRERKKMSQDKTAIKTHNPLNHIVETPSVL